MSIATRTGDDGTTGLFGGGRVPKDHLRVEAYGSIDELNALLGHVRATHALARDTDSVLLRVQSDLFALGADLATPRDMARAATGKTVAAFPAAAVAALDAALATVEAAVEPLRTFILPGGHPAAAALHVARTVCRRAERAIVALHRVTPVGDTILQYVNRLSDLLFLQARHENARSHTTETPWRPAP